METCTCRPRRSTSLLHGCVSAPAASWMLNSCCWNRTPGPDQIIHDNEIHLIRIYWDRWYFPTVALSHHLQQDTPSPSFSPVTPAGLCRDSLAPTGFLSFSQWSHELQPRLLSFWIWKLWNVVLIFSSVKTSVFCVSVFVTSRTRRCRHTRYFTAVSCIHKDVEWRLKNQREVIVSYFVL